MQNVVHIGLGKTATTTLQRHVFPEFCTLKGFKYNNPKLEELLKKNSQIDLSDREIDIIKDILITGNNFISIESLIDWNPANWEDAAERNLQIFGDSTVIIITLREAFSLITSVYQQKVHEGNVIRPEDFFVDKETYSVLKKSVSNRKLEYYCTDFLCYEELVKFYTIRFSKVICVDMDNIGKFLFLDAISKLDKLEMNSIRKKFSNAPRANKGYSNLAMKLTFQRERVLRKLGVKSMGSNDTRLEDINKRFRVQKGTSTQEPYQNLQMKEKIFQFPMRVLKRTIRVFSIPLWRSLMQNKLDKTLPYVKYELPINDLKIDKHTLENSNKFLKTLNPER